MCSNQYYKARCILMERSSIIEYCLTKKGTSQEYPFGPDVIVMKVRSKMFSLISPSAKKPTLSLKCDPFLAENLRSQYPSVTPGYHMNKRHWNTIVVDGSVPDHEIRWMIDHSYELVVKSLTKIEREGL